MLVCKHPKEFGFVLGLSVKVGDGRRSAEVLTCEDAGQRLKDVVYIALLDRNSRALKVGQTRGTALSRWQGTLKVMNRAEDDPKLRKNERWDGDMLLQYTINGGLSIWIKKAEQVEIPYARTLGAFSMRSAEEEFLDWYYQPLVGQELAARRSNPRAGWSSSQLKLTRRMLTDPPLAAVSDGTLRMKNFYDSASGFIQVNDILAKNWRIQVGPSVDRFRNIGELIRAGWAVD